ncbi:MAG: hypothetical protein JWO46_1721 [Nocardioidaceae bacterium]|nr:hypothetical protein [Nocardioidaceae bacterium]
MRMIRQRQGSHDLLHPADAIQLDDMAGRGELDAQLRWLHHMFFLDEESAREACRLATAAGWNQDWLSAQPDPYPGWVLRAGRDVVLTSEVVQAARDFFEDLCERTGGTYAGWDVRRVPKHALS